jgi:hypothetical protein
MRLDAIPVWINREEVLMMNNEDHGLLCIWMAGILALRKAIVAQKEHSGLAGILR